MVIVMNEIVGISSAEFDQYRALVADILPNTKQTLNETSQSSQTMPLPK